MVGMNVVWWGFWIDIRDLEGCGRNWNKKSRKTRFWLPLINFFHHNRSIRSEYEKKKKKLLSSGFYDWVKSTLNQRGRGMNQRSSILVKSLHLRKPHTTNIHPNPAYLAQTEHAGHIQAPSVHQAHPATPSRLQTQRENRFCHHPWLFRFGTGDLLSF